MPLSFLARLASGNARLQRLGGKSGARKMYAWWKRIRLENNYANWTYRNPWTLMGCYREC